MKTPYQIYGGPLLCLVGEPETCRAVGQFVAEFRGEQVRFLESPTGDQMPRTAGATRTLRDQVLSNLAEKRAVIVPAAHLLPGPLVAADVENLQIVTKWEIGRITPQKPNGFKTGPVRWIVLNEKGSMLLWAAQVLSHLPEIKETVGPRGRVLPNSPAAMPG